MTYASGERPEVGDVVAVVDESGRTIDGGRFTVAYPVGNTVKLIGFESVAVLWPVSIFALLRRSERKGGCDE